MADRRLELEGYHGKISLQPPDFKGKCGNDGVIRTPREVMGISVLVLHILSTK